MPITLNGSTGITDADGGTVLNTNDFASQAQAEAGTDNTTIMTPLRSAQAITALAPVPAIASQAQAEAGTDNTTIITPLRVRNALRASGSAPIFACRAWVRFNGYNGSIAASGNVSSVTYNGTGQSTVNFATAMQDTNYSAVCSGHGSPFGRQSNAFAYYAGYSTTSVIIWYGNTINAAAENMEAVNVAVFR